MKVTPIRTSVFQAGEDLLGFIQKHVADIPERSVLAVTSKIIALSEKRVDPDASMRRKEELIRMESDWAIQTKHVWLTIKDGSVMASAGIDESNAGGKLILLPKDSYRAASRLRRELMKIHRLKELGVIVTDSRLMPLRAGVVGVALGYAGVSGVRDYRGKKDIFGRVMRISRTDIADSLATAAVLVMGEGAEKQPLALIEDAPIDFREKVWRNELHIDVSEDIYGPLFRAVQ